jgi:nucleoside-diphosphate-sugar epimerase
MKVLITGGGGYVGTELVKSLLKKNIQIKVVDIFWFPNKLPKNKNLKIVKKDILKIEKKDLKGINTIIHLASIANDPASNLDPKLTWEISCLGTMRLCELAKKNKIKNFIYASSGSVYGIKKENKVNEDLDLLPISDYNKTKMIAERVLLSYKKYFKYFIIRPGTVFGYSDRMRLDLMINILAFQALTKKEITVFGGRQTRPFIHIDDMVSVYEHFIFRKNKSGIYNASYGNLSAIDTAKQICLKIPKTKINLKKSNDPRSYRLNSDKLKKTGFKFKINLQQGIDNFIKNFNSGKIVDNKSCYSINWINKKK